MGTHARAAPHGCDSQQILTPPQVAGAKSRCVTALLTVGKASGNDEHATPGRAGSTPLRRGLFFDSANRRRRCARRPVLRHAQDEHTSNSLRDNATQETLRNARAASGSDAASASAHRKRVHGLGSALPERFLALIHGLRDGAAICGTAGYASARSGGRVVHVREIALS